MYQKDEWESECKACWKTIIKEMPHWYARNQLPMTGEIAYGWELFQQAYNSSLDLFILGDAGLRSKQELLENFGISCIDPESTTKRMKTGILVGVGKKKVPDKYKHSNVKVSQKQYLDKKSKKALEDKIGRGSILKNLYWWTFFNDAWLLGGIHGFRDYYVALEQLSEDKLWDSKAKRPKMLGREIYILLKSGYKGYEWKRHGFGFTPDKKAPVMMKIKELHDAVAKIGDKDSFLKYIESKISRGVFKKI